MSETGWWGLCDARDACQDTHDWGFISGYPIDSEMGMGPDWAHGIFGGIPVAHGRMVGAGYFTYPRGSNFNGVVTTKLLAFFSRSVALQGASLFHQVRPRARRNLLEHELAGAGSGSHIMCVHQWSSGSGRNPEPP